MDKPTYDIDTSEVMFPPATPLTVPKVSSQVTLGQKGSPKKPPAKVEPKQLTKARPYKLDPFISERVKEIKALEKKMLQQLGVARENSNGRQPCAHTSCLQLQP